MAYFPILVTGAPPLRETCPDQGIVISVRIGGWGDHTHGQDIRTPSSADKLEANSQLRACDRVYGTWGCWALLLAAWHRTDQYANNGIECDHGRLKARLGPMRGRKQDRSARVIIAGHALVQNLRRGHCELAVDEPACRRLTTAFQELAVAI